MERRISVVIPNYNGGPTIGKCLEAVFSSEYGNFEVIVVDDCSEDGSAGIIGEFPCRLIRLDKNSGAAAARNIGAENISGEILFFIDADCILQKDTLSIVNRAFSGARDIVIGGTYTKVPYDDTFFSTFQSIFINYSETKKKEPDYIATHAMVMHPAAFAESSGFSGDSLPILEDVEFSHRLRRHGFKLLMNPDILVRHIFNFTLAESFRNAFRKSMYWIIYSLKNRDLLADSGTASLEIKINVVSFFINMSLIIFSFCCKRRGLLLPVPVIFLANVLASRRLLMEFYRSKGLLFAVAAAIYYTLLYPVAIGAGIFSGVMKYIRLNKFKGIAA